MGIKKQFPTQFETEKTVLTSLSLGHLQSLIIDSVNVCLENFNSGSPVIPKQKTIVDTEQLMERLNVTRPTVQRWRDTGRIPFIQVGNVVRYDLDAVLEALSKKKGGKKC